MTAETRTLFEPAAIGERTRLAASRCPDCDRVQFPAADPCPACGAAAQAIWLAGPARVVFATEILHQPPDSMIESPYPIGVAEFPEGLRIIGPLEGPPARQGDSVVAVVSRPADNLVTYAFRLATGVT